MQLPHTKVYQDFSRYKQNSAIIYEYKVGTLGNTMYSGIKRRSVRCKYTGLPENRNKQHHLYIQNHDRI